MDSDSAHPAAWRKRPLIYEIHTWAWLNELRARYRAPLTLAEIPAAEWDALAGIHADAVWFMGVWQRSPLGVAVSNANETQQAEFRRTLPDYQLSDNVGSAYCVRAYTVDENFGGNLALAAARAELARRGINLLLDFVPNHIALDHPWVAAHPEYLIRGDADDLARAPTEFVELDGQIIANGRDPYFAPWRDVVQLNAFNDGLRAAAIETLSTLAAQCDGVRCDMAMLLLNEVFARTWGQRAGVTPAVEYWDEVLAAIKSRHPDFIFIAEAYWDLEYALIQKGFDYGYDKRLYDRLVAADAEGVRTHLQAGLDYQEHLVRFIENHDEPRAAAVLTPERERAAAIVVSTVRGAKLVNDGQLEGRKIKLPVFLARRPTEPRSYELDSFYRALFKTLHTDIFHQGAWTLCERHGWSDNESFHSILAWTWHYESQRILIVVNLSERRAQAMVQMPWNDLSGRVWRLSDVLNGDVYLREGSQLDEAGLFVDLDAWRYHFLAFG